MVNRISCTQDPSNLYEDAKYGWGFFLSFNFPFYTEGSSFGEISLGCQESLVVYLAHCYLSWDSQQFPDINPLHF